MGKMLDTYREQVRDLLDGGCAEWASPEAKRISRKSPAVASVIALRRGAEPDAEEAPTGPDPAA